MNTNIEIEFKCPISKDEYESLIKLFDLENNIYKQTNFYFDTEDRYFLKQKTTLRIRLKHPNRYKVTLKTSSKEGALEQHVFLSPEKALMMIDQGFNTFDFFEIDQNVTLFGKLDNYRVSTPYKSGELFLDKVEYFDLVDYEIEYEVDNYETGKKDFERFLSENKITRKPSQRKSERIYNYIQKNPVKK